MIQSIDQSINQVYLIYRLASHNRYVDLQEGHVDMQKTNTIEMTKVLPPNPSIHPTLKTKKINKENA
jgi:hypothetical protein